MQSVPRLPVLLLITGATVLAIHAQQTPQKSAAVLPRRFAFLVPFIPTVSGAPFSAQYIIQMDQPVTGGSSETWHSVTQVARDSNGRIRHELHDFVPPAFCKEPPLLSVVLTDPVARLSHTLDPVLQTDDRQWFHAPPPGQSAFDSLQGDDLGSKIINGLEVKGVRRAWTAPTRTSASGQPDQVVDETWYSNELKLIVSEQQTDSLGRGVTITLSQIDRGKPPASLFKTPHGYHLPAQRNVVSGNRGPLTPPGVPGGTIPGADWDPIANNGGIHNRL